MRIIKSNESSWLEVGSFLILTNLLMLNASCLGQLWILNTGCKIFLINKHKLIIALVSWLSVKYGTERRATVQMVTSLSEGSAASLSDSPRGLNTIPSILPTMSQVSREPTQNRTKGAFYKVKNPYLSTWWSIWHLPDAGNSGLGLANCCSGGSWVSWEPALYAGNSVGAPRPLSKQNSVAYPPALSE